jgi:hypothetical protein
MVVVIKPTGEGLYCEENDGQNLQSRKKEKKNNNGCLINNGQLLFSVFEALKHP